jgi:hypothetical protein
VDVVVVVVVVVAADAEAAGEPADADVAGAETAEEWDEDVVREKHDDAWHGEAEETRGGQAPVERVHTAAAMS